MDLLSKELYHKRNNRTTISYMPVERALRLIHKFLQVIASQNFPVHVIAKSNLVKRDTDILQELSEMYAVVSFTIPYTHDFLFQKIAPKTPITSERFKAMTMLAHQ
ncbi:MAG: hypothetical protein RR356_00545 [Bacteroidales bacterium]